MGYALRSMIRVRIAALLLPLLSLTAYAQQRVKVVGVTDGDTVKVLTKDKRTLKVRLNGIDAPESSQAFGEKSKQWLSAQVFGKEVDLYAEGTDRYGRTLGTIKIGGKSVNLASVRAGWAWWYRQYAKGRLDLSAAEKNAKTERLGIWSQGVAVAPWDYRRGKRSGAGATVARDPSSNAPSTRRSRAPLPSAQTDVSGTVYITRTGKRYHAAGCSSLRSSSIKTTRKAAEAQGLSPCQRCGG